MKIFLILLWRKGVELKYSALIFFLLFFNSKDCANSSSFCSFLWKFTPVNKLLACYVKKVKLGKESKISNNIQIFWVLRTILVGDHCVYPSKTGSRFFFRESNISSYICRKK